MLLYEQKNPFARGAETFSDRPSLQSEKRNKLRVLRFSVVNYNTDHRNDGQVLRFDAARRVVSKMALTKVRMKLKFQTFVALNNQLM